jgi:glycine/D-amino acid oxidase-like deaminating enzyme
VPANGATIRASKVLLATNAFATELQPTLTVVPGRGQVLVTEPLPDVALPGTFHYDHGYAYFRQLPDHRILLGGGRNLDFSAEETTAPGLTTTLPQPARCPRYFNILTLRPDTRGLNGVVSLEGTALGLAGTAVLATAYCLGFGWGPAFGWLLVAGTAGNLVDSVLGTTLERRGLLSNNAVNFINTLTGALVAGGLMKWLG